MLSWAYSVLSAHAERKSMLEVSEVDIIRGLSWMLELEIRRRSGRQTGGFLGFQPKVKRDNW